MKNMKKTFLNILFLSLTSLLYAQGGESVFRSSGKIWVVVGIILIIFFMIVLYLFRMDRRISRLEQKKK